MAAFPTCLPVYIPSFTFSFLEPFNPRFRRATAEPPSHLSSPLPARRARQGGMQWGTLLLSAQLVLIARGLFLPVLLLLQVCLQGTPKILHQSWAFEVQSKCSGIWNSVVYPSTVGSYSSVIVNCHSSSHRGNYNNRYVLWSSRWIDNAFLGLFKSSEAFLRSILDKEESFQSRQEFVGTSATCQDPKYLE